MPDVAVYPGENICSVYQDLFNIVIENGMKKSAGLAQKEKIYFSKAHLHDSKAIGEKLIESLMKKGRFDILYPEELSLTEQIFYW